MKRLWITCLLVVFGLGLGVGIGTAQQASPTSRVVGQIIEDFNDRNASGFLDEDIEALTGTEMLDRSQRTIRTMNGSLEGAEGMLERARNEERDIVKVNCLSEKLASIKGFLKVSEQSYVSLSDSVARSDEEASRHHYRLIAIAGHRVQGLAEEARVCAGEELRYAEDTLLDTIIDPSIGNPDDSLAGDTDIVLERLPKISPFY